MARRNFMIDTRGTKIREQLEQRLKVIILLSILKVARQGGHGQVARH